MKRLATKLSLLVASFVCLPLLMATPAGAIASPLDEACNTSGAGGSALCQEHNKTNKNSFLKILKTVINTLIMITGVIAVIFIVIGGMRYTLSGGDASNLAGAKNTIIYAIIGLVVAVLSYGIVNFVLGRL